MLRRIYSKIKLWKFFKEEGGTMPIFDNKKCGTSHKINTGGNVLVVFSNDICHKCNTKMNYVESCYKLWVCPNCHNVVSV